MKREREAMLENLKAMGPVPKARERVKKYENLSFCFEADRIRVPKGKNKREGRKTRDNSVQSNVVPLPAFNAPKESGGANIVSVGKDLRGSCPKFDEMGHVENFSLDSPGDFAKQIMVVDDDFLSLFVPPYDMDLSGDSNNGANVPQGTEMNVSTVREFIEVPKKLKDLLGTGLLEGFRVRYIHGPKSCKSELVGIIQGTQVLCSCVQCNGKVALTPNDFELHAHSRNKRPPESIYLDNGKSLRDVMNACKGAALGSMDAVIREAIRRSDETKCHGFKDGKSDVDDQRLIVCHQCDKEFDIRNLKDVPNGEWFCSPRCNHIFTELERLVEKGGHKLPEALMGFVKNGLHNYVSLRIFKGKEASKDAQMWLSSVVNIFHDQFDPIIDTGGRRRVDLVPQMVYGRNMVNQDFGNMLCAVLIVDSVVVCAAIFRIFGEEVAELPLVATKSDHQGKGYFQTLYYCIENLLSSLNVKSLVVPAAKKAKSLWTGRFGFSKIDHGKLKEYENNYPMMLFCGSSVLEKPLSHP